MTGKKLSDAARIKTNSGYRNGVSNRRISVRIEGSADERGAPSLNEFLKQLEAVKVALKHTARLTSGDDHQGVEFKIVDLSMSSPATVVLEETPMKVDGKRGTLTRIPVAPKFVSTLRQINQRGTVPAKIRDLAALEAYRNVGNALKHSGAVTITSARVAVAINPTFDEKIERIIGPDQVIEGSITGVLLSVNLHNTTRFEIYPPAGPPKVACDFPATLKQRVISGLDHNVRVIGRLRYKHWADLPHAITAEDIEIYPPNDELPTLTSLYGLAHREKSEAPPDDGE